MNLKDIEKGVTVGGSRTNNVKICGDWHGYQRRDGKPHQVILENTAVIKVRNTNLFRVIRALKKGFKGRQRVKP